MGHDHIREQIQHLDEFLARANVRVDASSPMSAQLDLVKAFLHDEHSFAENELLERWDAKFKEFYDAEIAVGRLCDAVPRLMDQPEGKLKRYLTKILGGSLTQNFDPQEARDLFYELWLASSLQEAGFAVSLEEPDIVVEGCGLSQKLGIACKYPSSGQQIHPHISKGYAQIVRHGFQGFVAIGVDQLLLRELFEFNFVDFRQSDPHPRDVLQRHANDLIVQLVKERPAKYPSEDPIDGLMLTLSAAGILGKPAGLISVNALALHCKATGPISTDIQRIRDGIASIKNGAPPA